MNIIREDNLQSVYVDGGKVICTFLERGLIDEITITQAPVILGKGIRLFSELARGFRLTLRKSTVYEGGMVLCKYDVRKELA